MTDHGTQTELACHSCRRPLGVTRYVIVGYLSTYSECEWCFTGADRPAEPELITDTFQETRSEPELELETILENMMLPEQR